MDKDISALIKLFSKTLDAFIERERIHDQEREKLLDRLMSKDLTEYRQFYLPEVEPEVPTDDGSVVDIIEAQQEIENGN